MFMPVDIGVEITEVKEEGRSFSILNEGQSTILNQAPQLPFANAEVVRCLPRSEETAVMVCGRRRKLHRKNLYCHLDRLDVLCQYVYKHYCRFEAE